MDYLKYLLIFLILLSLGSAFLWVYKHQHLFSGRVANLSGVWIDQTDKVAVEVYPCSRAICGKVVWVYGNPNGADGRRICGTMVLGGLYRTSGSTWDSGWIYNPLDGGRYSVYIRAVSNDVLSVTGYVGSRWFGQTFEWHRAAPNLKRCDK